ncbi:MAG: hypothetical protein E6J90_41770 [Deltaproteobacteria bacterium]|nr:MAG: hypothetical protein E6J90_41770 [Deltaproteobacteria bacterium]
MKNLCSASAIAMLAPIAAFVGLAVPLAARAQAVQVIDMIPQGMSNESRGDTEPYLAVNPDRPQIMAATAFMPTPAASSFGPLLVSTDGGTTWSANNIIPSSPGGLNTYDVTIHFNSSGTALFLGMIRAGTSNLEVARTTDMTLSTPMTVIDSHAPSDQPYLTARTVTGWYDSGKDRVWMANNDGSNSPKSATIDQSLDAGIGSPAWAQIRIDAGSPVGRDNYQVRTAAAPDGHIYGAFYRRKASVTGGYNADVVVVRDDNWGKTGTPFVVLVDSVTSAPGENVVASTRVSDTFGSDSTLGYDWWGGDLYLTVDQRDASRVYISYSDSQPGMDRTIHLRRSTTSGQTWGPDLLTVPGAKNAAIAINSQGKIAYLYQSLPGATGSKRWQTHLRRSASGTTWDDVMLSDFPADGPNAPAGNRILGDYLNLAAVGKNFYGVFSAYNHLDFAAFPAGITWQRNKTAASVTPKRFLALDNVTTVAASIDPFFFRTTEIDPSADFWIRDWTDSAAVHDRGNEPSVRANFFSTSDVWNERTNDPLAFDANDRPQSHDPQPAAMGHNYAFTRVARAAGTTAVDVTLRYLYSDGGVGVNYVSAGPPATLHFNVGETEKTVAAGSGYVWELPSGASNHVCLAVELSAPGDPIISPSLVGRAPGWPTTDLLVVNDNNKAQRNMQVFGFGGMSTAMTMYAIVHNAATVTRDMTVGVRLDRRSADLLKGSTLSVLGARGEKFKTNTRIAVTNNSVVKLDKMTPGENRWIELVYTPPPNVKDPAQIELHELVNGVAINGYTFLATPMPLPQAIEETLFQHAAVFHRLGELHGLDVARTHAKLALELAQKRATDAYPRFLVERTAEVAQVTEEMLKRGGGADAVGTLAMAKQLAQMAKAGQRVTERAQPLHRALLAKLDAMATMIQKSEGDVADIPQNVRWQIEVFKKSREVADRSTAFLGALDRGSAGVDAFRDLVKSLLPIYQDAAKNERTGSARKALEALERAKSLAALQHAHRELLLALTASP